mgnify:CR=1 FL=1
MTGVQTCALPISIVKNSGYDIFSLGKNETGGSILRKVLAVSGIPYEERREYLLAGGPQEGFEVRAGEADDAATLRFSRFRRIDVAELDKRLASDTPPLVLGRHPKVLATPHQGGMVPESVASQANDTVEQAAAVLAGRMPKCAVNPEAATRLARLRR